MTRRRRRLVREAGGVADAGFAGDGGDCGNDGDSGGDGCGDDGPGESGVSGTMGECLACFGDFSMRKRRERADGDTRGDTRDGAMCGRTAVPVRRAVFSSSSMSAGEGHSASFFSFAPSCLLPALSCPYHPVVSYRLRPVEALRGGRRGVGDMPRRVDGVIWLLVSRPVLSSRSAARSVSPYRIAGGGVRRFCQLILLRHSLAAGRIVFSFVSSLVSLARLVGRLVLFFAARLSIRFISSVCWRLVVSSRPGGPSLVHQSCSSRRSSPSRFGVSSCPVPCCPSRPSVSSSSPCSFFSLGGSSRRLVWRGVFSLSPVSFSSVLVLSRLLRFMAMGRGGGSSCSCLVAVCFFPCCHPSSLRSWRWRNGRAVRRYGGTRRFYSARFPIR